MSVIWGWPLGLAAFVAVLLPIWLHLDRRRSMRVLRFAAMRFIGMAHPPKRTWRLIEWLLLLVRMVLLAAVVLWLAQPTWVGEWRAPQRVLAAVPGVTFAQIRAHADGYDRVLWLRSGLPEIELASLDFAETAPASDVAQPALSSLLRQLDSELAPRDQLRVLVGEQISGLDAQTVALSREVEWRIARSVLSETGGPSASVDSPVRRTLAIRYAAADAPALRWLRAAIGAWARDDSLPVTVDDQPVSAALPEAVDALIWLGDEPSAAAQALLTAGSRVLHLRAATAADTHTTNAPWPGIRQRVEGGSLTWVSDHFSARELPILHSPEFPAALYALLFGEPPPPTHAYAEQVEPSLISRPAEPIKTPLRPWLAWLIASLFLLERALATGRRLRGAA